MFVDIGNEIGISGADNIHLGQIRRPDELYTSLSTKKSYLE